MLRRHRKDLRRRALILGRVVITADRWPWQVRRHVAVMSGPGETVGKRYGWKPTQGTGRFGGGWNWNLGVRVGGSTVILELLFGMVRVTWWKKEREEWF